MHRIEDVLRNLDYNAKILILEMSLNSKHQLTNVFSSYSFIVEHEQLLANEKRVDIFELLGEDHLTVPVQLLEHVGIAVLKAIEEDFYLLKDIFLGF